MSESDAVVTVTFEEYLAIEQEGIRHELVGGRMYAMAGGTERHDLMAGAIRRRVEPGALAAGCRPFDGNRCLHTPSGSAYCPDIMVVCGPAADTYHEDDASLIAEVLSPGTTSVDRREKFEAYRQLPSLALYLLVDLVFRRFEAYRPNPDALEPNWQAYGPGGFLFTPYGALHLDEIYAEVDQLATT